MRHYVRCHSHTDEKIYVRFEQEPATREQIPEWFFADCTRTQQRDTYSRKEVTAEIGPSFIAGAVAVAALLVLVDPIVGIISAIGGALGLQNEQKKIDTFNQSGRLTSQ